MGILAGWYLSITKHSPTRLSKVYPFIPTIFRVYDQHVYVFILFKPLVAIGWTLSIAVGLAIVYGLAPYVDESTVPEISPALKMTYGPLHRTAWACVIAWIIFACSRGYGGMF